MKKIIITLSLILLVGLFGGCGLFNKKDDNNTPVEPTQPTGQITYTTIDCRKGNWNIQTATYSYSFIIRIKNTTNEDTVFACNLFNVKCYDLQNNILRKTQSVRSISEYNENLGTKGESYNTNFTVKNNTTLTIYIHFDNGDKLYQHQLQYNATKIASFDTNELYEVTNIR